MNCTLSVSSFDFLSFLISSHIILSPLSYTKPITLLLESMAAKDMSCLIAGYCRVFVDPSLNIFPWIDDPKKHRVSAEEGTKETHVYSNIQPLIYSVQTSWVGPMDQTIIHCRWLTVEQCWVHARFNLI